MAYKFNFFNTLKNRETSSPLSKKLGKNCKKTIFFGISFSCNSIKSIQENMENDPFIKTSAEIIFYVALIALIIVLILKKRKQLHVIEENTPNKDNNKEEE